MLRLSVLDKRISDARAAKLKAEKLLQNLDAPRIAYEAAAQQEAELIAQQEAAKAEYDQLTAERADLAGDIERLAYAQDVTALIRALEPADRYRSGRFHSSVYSLAIAALKDDHETLQTYQQRLAVIDRRLKELGEG